MENILKHGHARNNQSVLFNICAALIIHTTDLVQTECPDLKDEIEKVLLTSSSVETDAETPRASPLLRCITQKVSESTLQVGRLCRERVSTFFSQSPNGKHIDTTFLFVCLLLTVGFHVLSRTGHTDVLDSFWLRLNNLLHASGHLKYQELYLFYGFFRSIMPHVSFTDLFKNKPGTMVA